mmetsp:Transcript_39439/g.60255  ORF Transcript_39439/g.60255 Transcript_39439/m.60255 type:complete len:222 (-) Transcript_39439:628-1293(-)|eukprot:CAMPEP_0170501196 /NCGR_PEP_ID=MMETSP0208-20121228/37521_1 /TAXON_ID=197538 /ORGANISM="Strombidium inclinatum, Strain S3" /LENGTH=221 /DNA_ID=CAMNT_0010779609 /DNA_START=344 /DNA_END=1009 /DNA_ORIENTATION=-
MVLLLLEHRLLGTHQQGEVLVLGLKQRLLHADVVLLEAHVLGSLLRLPEMCLPGFNDFLLDFFLLDLLPDHFKGSLAGLVDPLHRSGFFLLEHSDSILELLDILTLFNPDLASFLPVSELLLLLGRHRRQLVFILDLYSDRRPLIRLVFSAGNHLSGPEVGDVLLLNVDLLGEVKLLGPLGALVPPVEQPGFAFLSAVGDYVVEVDVQQLLRGSIVLYRVL